MKLSTNEFKSTWILVRYTRRNFLIVILLQSIVSANVFIMIVGVKAYALRDKCKLAIMSFKFTWGRPNPTTSVTALLELWNPALWKPLHSDSVRFAAVNWKNRLLNFRLSFKINRNFSSKSLNSEWLSVLAYLLKHSFPQLSYCFDSMSLFPWQLDFLY